MAEHNNSQGFSAKDNSDQSDTKLASEKSLEDNIKNSVNTIKSFLLLFCKNKSMMISNGLLALGTVGSEELYHWLAFQCPCASTQNHWYGLMIIMLPTLVLFIFSIILNNETWHMGANCHSRKPKYTLQLLGSIVVNAAMAPVIWSIILLLHGEAYICAFIEFVDPTSFSAGEEKFPVTNATQILARFPCMKDPDSLSVFRNKVRHKLLRESQLLGMLLISMVAILMILIKSLQHCCIDVDDTYEHHYIASEEQFTWETIKIKARLKAANRVECKYNFVVLNEKDENMRKKYNVKSTKKDHDCGIITDKTPPQIQPPAQEQPPGTEERSQEVRVLAHGSE